ncbi:MAG: hypothetical protein ACYC6N_03835 [Pirellulaceae bacterium]
MYSATFALTAIFGIALTNLFLGFAFAMLLGRGPRSLADLENAVTVRYFSPQLLFPFAHRGSKRKQIVASASSPVPPSAVTTPAPAAHCIAPAETSPTAATATATATAGVSPAAVQSIAIAKTTPRFVLPPDPVTPPQALDEAPDVVLRGQLEAWQASNPREENASLSGFAVMLPGSDAGAQVQTALMKAVLAKITTQLRKDRRVLQIADNLFLWFSADVQPDDGLLPVGRIRQILDKTRFLHEDTALTVEAHAAVLAVTLHDNAADLIERLQTTLKFAQEKAGQSLCIDVGDGPAFVEPLLLDVDQTEVVLA